MCGQIKLEQGYLTEAEQFYRQVIDIIKQVEEENIWVYATAATAAIVTNNKELAIEHLTAIRESSPTPESLKSIERGLETTKRQLQLDEETYNRYIGALHQ